ncbi:MAG: hypothetical protein ABJB47_10205 [Actinomycetota bacterium]
MLLDEPFSALDSKLRGGMDDLLLALRGALEPTLVLASARWRARRDAARGFWSRCC